MWKYRREVCRWLPVDGCGATSEGLPPMRAHRIVGTQWSYVQR